MEFTKIASFIALVGAAFAAPTPEPAKGTSSTHRPLTCLPQTNKFSDWQAYGLAHTLKMAQD